MREFSYKWVAALLLVVAVAAYSLLRLNLPASALLPISAAIVIGMGVPDFDAPLKFLRNQVRIVSFLAAFALCIFLLTTRAPDLLDACSRLFSRDSCTLAAVATSFVLALMLSSAIDFLLPFRRGPFHGFVPALIFAIGVFIALTYLGEPRNIVIYSALAGLASYLIHVVIDFNKE